MKYKIKAYSIQEYGQRKDEQGNPHQEDSIYPQHGHLSDNDRLFILCDGMGGHDAGEVASATVCEAMSKSVMANSADSEALFTDDMLQQAVSDAFAALDARDSGTSKKKMGTTMTFLKLHAGGATIAHMGDSRVYHIRPGKDADSTRILFETEDHSLVNDLVKIHELTPEEARVSPQKNVITRAMQPHMERRPKADVYHTADIQPGDYFYMCTDGMLEQMEDDNIRFNFSDMNGDDANKVRVLTDATVDNRDNHTAIIVHITEVEGQPVPLPSAVPPPPPATTFTADAVDDTTVTQQSTTLPHESGRPAAPHQDGGRSPKKTGIQKMFLALIGVAIVVGIAYFAVPLLLSQKSADSDGKPTEQTSGNDNTPATDVVPTQQPATQPNAQPTTQQSAAQQQHNVQQPAQNNGTDEQASPVKPGTPVKPGIPIRQGLPVKPVKPVKPDNTPATGTAASTAQPHKESEATHQIRENFRKQNEQVAPSTLDAAQEGSTQVQKKATK